MKRWRVEGGGWRGEGGRRRKKRGKVPALNPAAIQARNEARHCPL
jgi:hypothetical protein